MAGKPRPITDYERSVIFNLAGQDERNFPIILSMCNLHLKRKGAVFRYMMAKGIKGQYFYEFAQRNKFNPFSMFKAIVDQIDGDMSRPLHVKDLTH